MSLASELGYRNYSTLERILAKTTLTTQRSCHGRIIDIGDDLLVTTDSNFDALKAKVVGEALEEARAKHAQHTERICRRLTDRMKRKQESILSENEQKFEEESRKSTEEWNLDQQLRELEMRRQFDKELDEILKVSAEELAQRKTKMIEDACALLTRQLKNKFAYEKEKNIARELSIARERFRVEQVETLKKLEKEIKADMKREEEILTQIHQQQIRNQMQRYQNLKQHYENVIEYSHRMEDNFRDMQSDYMRLLDNTQGYYHSDYMMQPRKHTLPNTDSQTDKTTEKFLVVYRHSDSVGIVQF